MGGTARERTRTTWLLLLGVGLTAMTAVAAVAPGAAANPAQVPAVSVPGIAAAGETPCSSCLKCPCGCSPRAGVWAAKLSSSMDKDVNTPATGRAFIRVIEAEQKVCFVLTVQDIKDVTKATLQINRADAVVLFPFPPDTKSEDGDCDGLLSCGCFYVNNCMGSWKGKKCVDIVKAIEEGNATVVVSTRKFPKGELCGKVEDL